MVEVKMMALEGIKVLDLSRIMPGPTCTMFLADMGAEVIRILAPAPRATPGVDIDERGAARNNFARNKKSMVLNLRAVAGKKIFLDLASKADVIVEEFSPGTTKRLGIDYDTVNRLNPRIIYCAISGYGQDGPYRDIPGGDPNYVAAAGAVALNKDEHGRPRRIDLPLADVSAALHAVIGILFAIIARYRIGRGQFVDVALSESALTFVSQRLAHYMREGSPMTWSPITTGIWQTKDNKFISTGVGEQQRWERFCRVLGREDLIPYRTAEGEKQDEVCRSIQETILTKTRDEWFQSMSAADISVAPVSEFEDLLSDPQLRHRNMFLELEHPTQGKVKQFGMPVKLSETPGKFRSFAPLPNQHTEEILLGLGYTKEAIGNLRNEGVIE